MKKYMLFAGDNNYPNGGMNDFRGSYNTKQESIEARDQILDFYEWAHICNTSNDTII